VKDDGSTPLHVACYKNNHEIIECLFDAGVNVDACMALSRE
jgi:ankyrin repeat protein